MKPKYNIGDKVWKLNDDEVKEMTITGIFLEQTPISEYFTYTDFVTDYEVYFGTSNKALSPRYYQEERLFPTKEELIASL